MAVFLDNMTMQGALRLLAQGVGRQNFAVNRTHQGKWNYDLNEKLRTAIDVACLGQLCQAVLMYDEIRTSADFAQNWRKWADELQEVADLVQVVDGEPTDDKGRRLASTVRTAVEVAATDAFSTYVSALASEKAIGTLLSISNGYFETGYCDPGVLPDTQSLYGPHNIENLVAQRYESERNALKAVKRSSVRSTRAALRSAEQRSSTNRELTQCLKRLQEYQEGSHPLRGVAPLGISGYELSGAAVAFVQNLAASLYFSELSRRSGDDYLPHPLRAPFAVLDEHVAISEQSVAALLSFARATRAARLNEIIAEPANPDDGLPRLGYIEVNFPFALGLVLQECETDKSVLDQLIILRHSRASERFRRWFTSFRYKVRRGDASISEMEKAASDLRIACQRWVEDSGSRGEGGTITIGVQLGFLHAEKKFSMLGIRRRPGHLRLVEDMANISEVMPSMAPELARVLGEEVGDAWAESQRLFSKLRMPGQASALDLRLE